MNMEVKWGIRPAEKHIKNKTIKRRTLHQLMIIIKSQVIEEESTSCTLGDTKIVKQ